MLERKTLGDIPPKPHTVFRRGETTMSEYVFTRDGFSGGFSILYTTEAPTAVAEVSLSKISPDRLLGETLANTNLANARRHFRGTPESGATDLVSSRTAMLSNQSCRVSTVDLMAAECDYAFCNGDADELYFINQGEGELWSMYGRLPFRVHDYVLVPRGVPYKFKSKSRLDALCIEGDPFVDIPSDFRNTTGQLKLEAPYTHRDFLGPTELLSPAETEDFKRILTLKNRALTEHVYAKSPCQTVGWDGSVYPVTFNIHDYLPKTGKIHLPPNLHLTFKGPDFVVCSFVPRLVDYGENAIPCPYPHANVECDEILYYVSGDFTSREGIGPRSITLHPAGLPHGPQPGRYLQSVNAKSTNELAVMVDTWKPLEITKACLEREDASYQTSWVKS